LARRWQTPSLLAKREMQSWLACRYDGHSGGGLDRVTITAYSDTDCWRQLSSPLVIGA